MGCFERRTYKNGLPVLGKISPGWNTPPLSLYITHQTAEQSSPWSTRLWEIFAYCSKVSYPMMVERYCVQVHTVSSANISDSPFYFH